MKRIIWVLLSSVFLTACNSGFQHRLPVRESYVRVKLGEPIPKTLDLTDRVELDNGQALAGATATHEWECSTWADEWALYLVDPDGLVVAKSYQVDGEEMTIVPFHGKRISEADWSWEMNPNVSDSYVEARNMCAKLRPETLGWEVGSYDVQAMTDDNVGPIPAESVLDQAQHVCAHVQHHFDYDKLVKFDREAPVLERSVHYSLKSKGSVAQMSESRRLILSGTEWTAMGWAYAIRYHELP